jgi:hypothetical protein
LETNRLVTDFKKVPVGLPPPPLTFDSKLLTAKLLHFTSITVNSFDSLAVITLSAILFEFSFTILTMGGK